MNCTTGFAKRLGFEGRVEKWKGTPESIRWGNVEAAEGLWEVRVGERK